MNRDINWVTKRDDGSRYDVRVHWFSGTYKFQFKERGADRWDYDRKPSREDLETFLDAIDRRYHRRQATLKEFEEAKRIVAAGPPSENEEAAPE
jgi:hypothetical protein